MNKIKRYLSFTLALIMILGMVVPPSPVSAEEKNEDVPYTIENINGVTYKVYDFTDLFGKDSLKEETSEATVFNDELGISALNVPQAVGEAQIKPGDSIPGGYKLTVDWGCYDLKASDIGTDIRLMIRDRDSRKIIAQTDPITAQSNGIEYYEFKATDKWNDAGTHHQPKVDGVTKWSLVTPASILYEVRVKTSDHTGWDANDISFIVAQQASTIYRAEYYSNSQNLPSIEAQKTNTKDKKRKVGINNKNLSDNEYYSFGDQEDRFLKNKPYFKGKELKIIEYGTDDLESLKVSDSITAERAKIAIKVPGSNDFNRVGSFTDNGVPYHYEVTGDYKSIHLAKLRQDLNVKFDPNEATFDQAVKTEQTIGHSMKVGEKFGDLAPVEIPKENQITNIPKFKDTVNNKELEQKFIGWTLTKTTGADFKDKTEEEIKELLVDFDKYEVKEDNVTFYAAYAPKAQGKIEVKYVAESDKNTDLNTDLLMANQFKDGKEIVKKLEDNADQTITKANAEAKIKEVLKDAKAQAPVFVGYKFKAVEATENLTYKKDNFDTIKYVYEKLDDIIELQKPSDEFPDGYVGVKFFADDSANDRGEFTGNKTVVVYAVNPINTEIDTTAKTLKGKKADGITDINEKFPTYSVNQASQDTWKTNDTAPWVMNPKDAIKADKKIDLDKLGTDKDLTFTAQYVEKGKHTVTFNSDGGTPTPNAQQVTDGQKAKAPTTEPTKAGYEFKEWQKNGQTYDFNTAVTENITLKAFYTENDVKFEYVSEDANKGAVDKANETIKAATGTPEGSTATAANGYRFTHWTKEGDTNFKVETAKVTPEKTNKIYVKAKYTAHFAKEVSVKYDLNAPSGLTAKGTAPTDNTKYIAGGKATVLGLPAGAGVDGCEFQGWSTDKNAKNATFKANDQMDITGEEDVTLYGVWKKDTKTVEFSFKFYNSKKPTEELPANVVSGNFDPEVPKAQTGKYVGDTIQLQEFGDVKRDKDKKGNDLGLQGTWKFDGWYRGDKKLTAADAKVSATDAENKLVGKWVLNETATKVITREFVIDKNIMGADKDVPVGHVLPQDVTKQKPNDTTNYIGSKQTPGKDDFKAVSQEINGKKGMWTFKEWDPKDLIVKENPSETENKFTGTWTWKEAEKVTVKYVFNTNPADKKLPKELADLKPADGTDKIYETDVVPPTPLNLSSEAVQKALVEKDKDGKEIGTWTAGNWSNPVKDDVNKTLTFTLTWTFTEAGKPAPQPEQPPMPDYNPWWPIWFGSTKTEVKKEEPKHLERHDAYIAGYPDGTVRPDGKITRAEVSAIFARLTENSAPANYSPKFSDVLAYDWFCDSVMKLSNKDIIKGYPDGTFKPNKSITRAEFAVIASKYIKNPKTADETFSDVPMNHWAKDAIAMVKAEGWISGYTDGTFKPDAPITRAEAVSIVNRMFDRAADGEFVREHGFEITKFGDLNSNHWAYYEMIEATHSHDYERIDKRTERWEKIVK